MARTLSTKQNLRLSADQGFSRDEPAEFFRTGNSFRKSFMAAIKCGMKGLFAAVLLASLWVGWANRDDIQITPDKGTGYWLGICGGVAMLLLLLYPLRKRLRGMRALGTVAGWFRLHMFLGLVGPVLILFHANFKLGSTNSNVALVSMLCVAGSGIVGRYLYGKIHLGLNGKKAEIRSILEEAASIRAELGGELALDSDSLAILDGFSVTVLHPPSGVLRNALGLMVLGWRARRFRRMLLQKAKRKIAAEAKDRGWPRRVRRQRLALVRGQLSMFFSVVRKAATFALFLRLFGLWHVLHLPLFCLLIIAAVLHVVAVHTY